MTRPPRLNSVQEKSYERYFFCSSCREWFLKRQAEYDALGRPRCPWCGKPLRTNGRWKQKQ